MLARYISLSAFALVATTAAAQDTYFIDDARTMNGLGAWWYQGFTTFGTVRFVARFASDYKADCAVIPANQLDNFINNRTVSGYAVFDDAFGTKSVTLAKGKYYFAVRNQTTASNSVRCELDYDVADRLAGYVRRGTLMSKATYVNGWFTHSFTTSKGYRFFMDGCNSGKLDVFMIPGSETTRFQNGQSFKYYTAYSGSTTDQPGGYELKLNPGNYTLAVRSKGGGHALTYLLDYFSPSRGGLDAETEGSAPKTKTPLAMLDEFVGSEGVSRVLLFAATAAGDGKLRLHFTNPVTMRQPNDRLAFRVFVNGESRTTAYVDTSDGLMVDITLRQKVRKGDRVRIEWSDMKDSLGNEVSGSSEVITIE